MFDNMIAEQRWAFEIRIPQRFTRTMDTAGSVKGTTPVRWRRQESSPPGLLPLDLLGVGCRGGRCATWRLSMATLAFGALFLFTGCSVGMALVGKKGTNRDVIREGVTREEVEEHLGTPIVSVTSPDARRFSTYKYVEEKPPSPGRAALHGVADVLTLGLAELGGTLMELAPKHSITVIFGQDNRVIETSGIWPGDVDIMGLQKEYVGPKVTPLTDRGAVTIYHFSDKRQVPNLIGTHVSYGRANTYPRTIFSREPVALVATKAFSEAIKARGFQVIDREDTLFTPGSSDGGIAPALTGEVADISYEGMVSWASLVVQAAQRVRCTIVLQVYDVTTGQKLWEKTYSRIHPGNGSDKQREGKPTYSRNPVAQVLAEIVEEAVYDPEFMRELRRR